jgi:hypothetical protein
MKTVKSPLQMMKDQFGTKDKLVAAVVEAINPAKDKKAELETKLTKQSNKKLFVLLARSKKA